MSEKPQVNVPEGDPTGKQLGIVDIIDGDGEQAQAGQIAEVHYVGVSWNTGNEFDASWNRGQTFSFKLGGGQVISGWDQGVVGMRIGGRRELTIPPALGYGSAGAGGVIGPNEHLIFVVDLVSLRYPLSRLSGARLFAPHGDYRTSLQHKSVFQSLIGDL